MWTEEIYSDLKGHGFDLEATNLNDADRIARLVLAACLTFAISTGFCGCRPKPHFQAFCHKI